jgi:class 3 adenylate cyclase
MATEAAVPDGERRQVTVLFADLVGFTAFSERSGEEAAFALMRRVAGTMTSVVEEQGGSVRKNPLFSTLSSDSLRSRSLDDCL